MVRKLKFHEQKLLKKVDFLTWKVDNNLHEVKHLKRYFVQKREDYSKYNQLAKEIRSIAHKIKSLDNDSVFRANASARLLEKLHGMGLIDTKWDLGNCNHVTAASFCRRRLPVMMFKTKMAPTVKMATKFVEQGHVRVGAELVKDPALLVTRSMEDFVSWVDASAIRRHVLEYNELRDDYDIPS
uniref:U3 small nucleolar ribonucleoprotein protein IMP3 n=1 Tax=Lygus hesperus TaxID=30085 RepID=A0A0A9WC67_LYGHE